MRRNMHFEHKLYSFASHVLTSITLSMYTRIVICLQSEHHGNINKVWTPKLRTIEQNKESKPPRVPSPLRAKDALNKNRF